MLLPHNAHSGRAEILETALWQQYNEIAGIHRNEVRPVGSGKTLHQGRKKKLDGDMDQ